MAKHVTLAQLTSVVSSFATKNDARFLKKVDMGTLATKSAVGYNDLDTTENGLQDRFDALETAVGNLGTLATKSAVGYSDLDSTSNGLKDRFDALETAVAGLGDVATLDEIGESDLTEQLATKINGKADASDVYTTSQTYTKTEVDNLVSSRISSAYKAAGSVAFASLPSPAAGNLGNVYNVTDAFNPTSANFVDYVAGSAFPAGTNVVVVEATPAVEADPEQGVEAAAATYKYDVLQGWVDLSNYATTSVATTATNGLMSSSDKAKLDGFTEATDEEIETLINSIYYVAPEEPEEP